MKTWTVTPPSYRPGRVYDVVDPETGKTILARCIMVWSDGRAEFQRLEPEDPYRGLVSRSRAVFRRPLEPKGEPDVALEP